MQCPIISVIEFPSLNSPATGPAHDSHRDLPMLLLLTYAELHFFTARLHYVHVLRLQDCPSCPTAMIDHVGPTSTGVPPETLHPPTHHAQRRGHHRPRGRMAGRERRGGKGGRGTCGYGTMHGKFNIYKHCNN